jgi:hypothetical protein
MRCPYFTGCPHFTGLLFTAFTVLSWETGVELDYHPIPVSFGTHFLYLDKFIRNATQSLFIGLTGINLAHSRLVVPEQKQGTIIFCFHFFVLPPPPPNECARYNTMYANSNTKTCMSTLSKPFLNILRSKSKWTSRFAAWKLPQHQSQTLHFQQHNHHISLHATILPS